MAKTSISDVTNLYLTTISVLESKSHFVPFKFMGSIDRCIKWKFQIFDPIACVNTAHTANGSQLDELLPCRKDLKRNDNLNLNLE